MFKNLFSLLKKVLNSEKKLIWLSCLNNKQLNNNTYANNLVDLCSDLRKSYHIHVFIGQEKREKSHLCNHGTII